MKWSDWLGGVVVVAVVCVVGYFILSKTDRSEELRVLRACSLDGCNTLRASPGRRGTLSIQEVLDVACRSNKSIHIDDDLISRLERDKVWKQQGCLK